jgi:hypothetical protein
LIKGSEPKASSRTLSLTFSLVPIM